MFAFLTGSENSRRRKIWRREKIPGSLQAFFTHALVKLSQPTILLTETKK